MSAPEFAAYLPRVRSTFVPLLFRVGDLLRETL